MTPTEQDEKLFELCKQVYEATGWGDTDKVFSKVINRRAGSVTSVGRGYKATRKTDGYVVRVVRRDNRQKYTIPLYTSDYLLEKLPNGTTILKDVQGFKAWNVYNRKRIATYTCDSPVEALLKLTIKLHEEALL